MLADLFNSQNRGFTLWRLKRLVCVIAVISFIAKNWGTNLAALKYIWLSTMARAGDVPLEAFYVHVNAATTQVAGSIALLTSHVGGAWMVCLTINLFMPSYMTEVDLNVEREKAATYFKQIARETKGLKATQKIVEENALLRAELSKLREELQAIRVEASAITEKRSKKKSKTADTETDLFSDSASPSPKSQSPKTSRIPKSRRKPPAPKF